jgi:hypothetical protein
MEIFNDNYDTIRQEIGTIIDSFGKTKITRIIDNIETLSSFYNLLVDVNEEYDEEAIDVLLKNEKYIEINNGIRNSLHKRSINNFIENKDFHKYFSNKIIDLYNKDFNYYIAKSLYLRDYQMGEVICDFLNDEFNQADEFKKFLESGHVFRASTEDRNRKIQNIAGYTMYNFITNNSYIVVSDDKKIKDVDLMRILVHEYGHVVDNNNKNFASKKDINNYLWISPYIEVYSMMYEKLFYDYLIKNNIFKESAKWSLKQFYLGVYDNFNSVDYLANLDNYLLQNERYKKEENIVDQINLDEDGTMYIALAVLDDFDNASRYSYGGVFASYFADLKHNDKDAFNKYFHAFKERRFNLFNTKFFEDIGTTPEDIIKNYEKGLDEITNTKKLILK